MRAVLACGHKFLAMPPTMGLATGAAFVWAQIKLGLVVAGPSCQQAASTSQGGLAWAALGAVPASGLGIMCGLQPLAYVGAALVCDGPWLGSKPWPGVVWAVPACGHKFPAMPPAMGLATGAAFVWAQIKLGLVGGWP